MISSSLSLLSLLRGLPCLSPQKGNLNGAVMRTKPHLRSHGKALVAGDLTTLHVPRMTTAAGRTKSRCSASCGHAAALALGK